jgi:molybdenum cofactor cytidylyltransferase
LGNRNKSLNIKTGVIILAAGLGERLKTVGLKPFLLYKGKSFIQLAVEKVKSIGIDPLVIVTNKLYYPQILECNFPASIQINPHPEQGMLSSILIGLNEIESSGAGFFLCPIDYPLVQQKTYHKLLLAHQSQPHQIIKPVCNSRAGHPIVFPKNLIESLKQAPLDQGARVVTRQHVHQTSFIPVDDPGILLNINTPGLYFQYCK